MDTDHNNATGYHVNTIGADYMIENSYLYHYTGSGSDWSWGEQKSVNWQTNSISSGNRIEYEIPLADLGVSSGHFPVVFNAYDGITDDYAPNSGDYSLPVTLSLFEANVNGGRVILQWRTESEVENLGFEIYRSSNASESYVLLNSFRENPQLQGSGNSSAGHDYIYIDSTVIERETYFYKLADVNINGARTFHGPIRVQIESGMNTNVIKDYRLYPASPNPFNPITHIAFDLPQPSRVKLAVYNLLGQKVKTLVEKELTSGSYKVKWDGKDKVGEECSSGIYLYHLEAFGPGKSFIQTRKMLLLR